MILLGIIVSFSFFQRAGVAGNFILRALNFLIGKTIFFLPLLLFSGSFLVLKPQKKRIFAPLFCAILVLIVGITGTLEIQSPNRKDGGWLGQAIGKPLLNYFGFPVSLILLLSLVLIGGLIFWEFIPKAPLPPKTFRESIQKVPQEPSSEKEEKKKSIGEKPKFEIKPIKIIQKTKEFIPKEKPLESEFQAADFQKEKDSYKFLPITLLDTKPEKPAGGNIEQNALIIKKTLQDFGIEVEMSEINVGPTVTQYTLKPSEGVKLSKITSLNNDLALALASHPIRIEAPIPGRSLVGIEVPNKQRARVKTGTLINSQEFLKVPYPLNFALGQDVMGNPVYSDIGKMPHLLVAGATGSGKTICLNSLILSLIYRNSPKILRLILIDPKRVEFPVYTDLPHLLTPVIFNAQKSVNALNWLIGEMERRFEVLQEAGFRNIETYDKEFREKPKMEKEGFELMPYIILIIDELADLMATKGREIEAAVVRLSQLARAVGIHLVLATQRPSVEVITGLIKANITSRIAFQVASQVDSRTILDMAGAEKLLGSGDMLFLSSEFSKPKRIQGSFVSTGELKKVVDFIKKESSFEREANSLKESLEKELDTISEISPLASFEEDSLYDGAKEVVIQYKKASASLLQRRLKIGYARAARILDMLEEKGVVGPQDGARPREVFVKENVQTLNPNGQNGQSYSDF